MASGESHRNRLIHHKYNHIVDIGGIQLWDIVDVTNIYIYIYLYNLVGDFNPSEK